MKHRREADPVALSKLRPMSCFTAPPPPSSVSHQLHSREKTLKVKAGREEDGGNASEEEQVTDLHHAASVCNKSNLHLLTVFIIAHSRQGSENCHRCFKAYDKQEESSVYTYNFRVWLRWTTVGYTVIRIRCFNTILGQF